MIYPEQVSCVIVTRGNVDLSEIRESLPFEDVIVWDNSKQPLDMKVAGRYLGTTSAKHDVIAVQDDDAIVEDWLSILAHYEPGIVTCNMCPAHVDAYAHLGDGIALVGFGAVFDRNLIRSAFGRYSQAEGAPEFNKDRWAENELFIRECDRVFTALNRVKVVTVPYRNLAHEKTTSRMWREDRHGDDLLEIRKRISAVKAVAA